MSSSAGSKALQVVGAIIAIPVLIVFAIITWVGVPAPSVEISDPATGLDSVTWSASVAADGRLAIRIDDVFTDTVAHTVNIRVPTGARLLAFNGTPITAQNGVYAEGTATTKASITYELTGRVTRYRDGSLLRLAAINDTSIDGQQGLFPCPHCYIDRIDYGDTAVYGSLATKDASHATLQFIGLSSIRSAADDTAVRFVGIDRGSDDVSMLATLPDGATPDLPVRDGTVAQALAAARAELKPSGDPINSPQVPEGGTIWVPIALTILAIALIVWLVLAAKPKRSSST
ncbi:MAG: hypothetical protein JWL72_4560 [Ilumatobacteraceae bacterium]|nr:hypothetical protein [Ilumatobacteraceae bacterium]MCU1391222.1 hypothetical protein [Ilumatobacteraceae bacterium]